MKAYKGFNRDMTCRGFQYAEGQTYETDRAELCVAGFHACERPLDCFTYYEPKDSVYHEVELEDLDPRNGDDTKVAGRKITVGARLSIGQLVQAQFEYCKTHAAEEHTDPRQASAGLRGAASAGAYGAASAGAYGAASAGAYGAASAGLRGAASAGLRGAASAGAYGAASAGDGGAASAGDGGAASAGAYGAAVSRGTAEVGENGIACARGNGCRVKGGLGAVLVLVEENLNDYDLTAWHAAVVDGETIKPDTWYRLRDGAFEEVPDHDPIAANP